MVLQPTSPGATKNGIAAATERYTHDGTITITLDNCPETFKVSKALLCSTSDYFTKALEGQFSESKTRTLKLPGCDLPTFELFIFYFTTKNFPDFVAESDGKTLDRASVVDIQARLVHAWVFGDYLGLANFQNQAMNSLLDYLLISPILVSTVEIIFETAPLNCILRDVAVSECVWTEVFISPFSRTAMRRLAKLREVLFEFTQALMDHYERDIDSDQHPHTQENRREYMVLQDVLKGRS